MKPIVNLRVVQTIEWVKDANNGWMRVPVGYEIEMQREGSEEWNKLPVFMNEVSNPQKEAEDALGGA